MNYLNVIVPIYNESDEVILKLIEKLEVNLNKINDNWKIIIVDDGSKNNLWATISKLCQSNNKISGIKLSTNFGQHYAIKAGLDYAEANFIFVIDGDMQDDPKYLKELYFEIKKGYDVVFCERYKRKDIIQKILSKIFYFVFNFFSKNKLNSKIANFCIFNHIILKKLKKNKLTHMSFYGSIKSLNSAESVIKTIRNERFKDSKPVYSFLGRMRLAKNTLISFSDRLLYTSVIFGLVFFIISIVSTIYLIINKIYINPGAPVIGWTSLMTLILFSFGITNFSFGIMGLYINSIHQIVKNEDKYFIEEKFNLD